ncbi:hypothetical protein MF271_22695 (plasmid) [Deinococcus sp. KNUC1210]|uniref:hypothetical protein n=1 Tax=Deinococcus sp. KNUC1210 TaxID=2917691 RepID=UPI001EF03792|nr:hypothetical protein [Deinococcus sp. KNUC1210]ULH18275.1 hypothetical protein MF271_22695 [Deinococcus sp. KNUC1210]
MKRLLSVVGLLLAFCFLPVVLAQGMGDPTLPPSFDPHAWGASPFTLAAVVLFATASLKRAADRANWVLSVWVWWAISLVLGIVGALALNLLGYGAVLGTLSYPWAVLLFGLVAGISASGFRDLAKTIADWLMRPRTTVTITPGPQIQVPVGTPGSEGLHQLDGTINAVVPLTPGQPTQVKTGLEELK